MIKKLRIKFIMLSAASLLLLLVIIVASSNIINYNELVKDADRLIDVFADNDGRMIGKKRMERRPIPPEAIYGSRFFSVVVSPDDEIIAVNKDNIATVDEKQAGEYALLVLKKNKEKSFYGNYRYLIRKTTMGDNLVVFLDCEQSLDTFFDSLLVNCLISLGGFLIICVLIIIFSKWIVRPAAESYEKQKQFIAVAGHELKTPVTIIDADAEILGMDIGENEWLNDICSQTKRMADLTNDMICLSRMDDNSAHFQMIDFPVSDVVSETAASFQTLAKSSGRSIKTDIAPMLSLKGDEGSIRQLVGILLDNAVKYSAGDDITLGLERKNSNLVLTVKNSSDKVTDEQLKQFFDRFYRTETSKASGKGGYGLGLSIAKSIVEAHRGKITASAPGGSFVQITVILPIN